MNPTPHRAHPNAPADRTFSPARSRTASSLAATALVLGTARAFGDACQCADERFISAVRLYEGAHWHFAFDRLVVLAEHGHVPAAKLVLLMLRYGRSLYGTDFDAKPEQVARWAKQVLHVRRPLRSLHDT